MEVKKKNKPLDENSTAAINNGPGHTQTKVRRNGNAEPELKASQTLLQTTLDTSFNYIQVFKAVRDKQGKIIDFTWVLNNRKLIEKEGDRVGKSLLQLNPGVVPSGLFESFVRVTETGEPQTNEVYYGYEGYEDWFHQTITKLDDGFVLTGEIITERKKAEQEMLKLKDELAQKATDKYLSIFNSIDEGFHINEVIFDENGKAIDIAIIEENPAACKILGGSFAGKTIKDLKPDYPDDRLQIWAEVIKNGGSRRMTFYSQIWERWLDLHATKLGDENSRRVALVFQDISERKCAEEALRKNQEKLSMDLADTKLLQSLSSRLVAEDDVHSIYEQLLEAATSIMHSEKGDIQIFIPDRNELMLLAWKGLDAETAKNWEWVQLGSGTTCSDAFLESRRIIIPDLEAYYSQSETKILEVYRSAGIRSAQSTPLITRSGQIVGVLSTMWNDIHEPSERELQLLDILARQAADMIERKQKEDALRNSRKEMAMDLADTKLLQSISSMLIEENDIDTVYKQLLNAATVIMQSDMGSIQLFFPEKNELLQLLTKGFDEQMVKQWEWIKINSGTICSQAFKYNQRVIVRDVETEEFIKDTENLKGYRLAGIRAAQSTPLVTRSGHIVGMISTHWRNIHEPSERQLHLLDILARQAADMVERKQKEDALRKSQERLAADLEETKKLHAISSRLVVRTNLREIYEEILSIACDFMHSEMSSLQILTEKEELQLLAHKGFHPESAKFWKTVEANSASVCGVALAQNKRMIIPDVGTWDLIQGTKDLHAYRLSGIRTVQSTPLISFSGHIVGMISTHWRQVYEPSEHEFRLLDVLARQAADLIERKQHEEKYLTRLQEEVYERTKELKESKELLQNIAQAIPDMVSVQSYPSRKVIYYNREPYSLNGLNGDDLSKMTPEERNNLVHPEDIEGLKKYIGGFASISNEQILTYEYRVKSKIKDWIWLRTRGKIFERDQEGNVISFVNVIQNIDAQKEAEEEIAIQHKILKQAEELAKSGSWEYDRKAKELFWSDGMYALFHTKKSKHIKTTIYLDHVIEEDRLVAKKIVQDIESFKAFEKTLRLKFNGNTKTIRIKAAPLKNDKGEIEKMLGVDLDITSVQESEGKIKELNSSLFAMNKELSSINKELKNFNAITTNNYTEALRKIYVNLESIATTDARNLSDTSKGNIRKAQASIQKMKLLTNDIHNYLELYDAGIQKELVSPKTSLQWIIEKMKDKIAEAKASIEITEIPDLHADPALLSRLMYNLIDNSLKFRKPDEIPVIKISGKRISELSTAPLTLTGTPYTIITVSDNGLGFEFTDKVFELFIQLHEQRKQKGSGMGLPVCKKIMEMHGGFITAVSEPGRGATFSCYFPDKY